VSVKRPERVREVLGITFDPVDNLVSGFSGPESDSSKSAQHMAEPKGEGPKRPGFQALGGRTVTQF